MGSMRLDSMTSLTQMAIQQKSQWFGASVVVIVSGTGGITQRRIDKWKGGNILNLFFDNLVRTHMVWLNNPLLRGKARLKANWGE